MSYDMVYEDVPHVTRRAGDNLVAGQNNSTIILGRDRVGTVDSGYGSQSSGGKAAGAMHLIVGRKGNDPSIPEDAATVYLSAKSDPDDMAGTAGIGSVKKGIPSVILRADCVRIVPRSDFKVSVGKAYIIMTNDGKIIIDGDVQLGNGAADRIIRGDTFAAVWSSHVHPTPSGLSGTPQPLPQSVFSPRNRVG